MFEAVRRLRQPDPLPGRKFAIIEPNWTGILWMPLRTQVSCIQPNTLLLTFSGEFGIDEANCHGVKAIFSDSLCREEKRFILDLTGLDYIDSAGVGTILYFFAQVRGAGGAVCLVVKEGSPVQQAFIDWRATEAIPMSATIAEACKGFAILPQPDQ